MTQLTIQIPDDLAQSLKATALARKKSMEQVALDRLRSGFETVDSAPALLRALQELPGPSSAAVDDLELSLATSRLPLRDEGVFDDWPVP
jgi:plasmid stability protein